METNGTGAMVIDVANLVRSETSLRDADHRKDKFLATLAHELRNPLAVMSNCLQIWALGERSSAQLLDLRERMHRQVSQMSRLIDDLLDISRITNGKLELRRQTIDIKALVERVLEEIRPLIEKCGHCLVVSLPTEPLLVEGDASRLIQVFVNLIQNAAKYTPPDGCIWVSVEIDTHMAAVRVRDNGSGIPESMLSAIFECFTQVDGTHVRARGGLGIGLSLVKSIVEAHDGSVVVRSEGVGRGSEFTVRLPTLNDGGKVDPFTF